jgi:hypothetical protein
MRRPLVAAVALLVAAAGTVAMLVSQESHLSVRDRRWRQDVAYLARELPLVHVDGLTGGTRPSAWDIAAARLESEVPRLRNGQIIIGMAQLVAMLHDDETQVLLPPAPVYLFAATWLGGDLYLAALPAADRGLLGARIVALGGHPIGVVLGRLRAEIDYQDPGLARALEIGFDAITTQQPGYLNDADLLSWLGLTRTPDRTTLTVMTPSGRIRQLPLVSFGPGGGTSRPAPVAYAPRPLYEQHDNEPYWLTVLSASHAVYLRYSRCLDDGGFQKLAARALALMRANPDYRLIVDLRNNPGGDSEPFMALINGIAADPAIDRPGRVFGLVNGLTDSSASVDAYNLSTNTRAMLIGQPAADPIDEFGDDSGLLRLPYYGIVVQYTTEVVNSSQARLGIPAVTVAPTVQDLLTGADPVLAEALSYR